MSEIAALLDALNDEDISVTYRDGEIYISIASQAVERSETYDLATQIAIAG